LPEIPQHVGGMHRHRKQLYISSRVHGRTME
jgi:hypothetical protein